MGDKVEQEVSKSLAQHKENDKTKQNTPNQEKEIKPEETCSEKKMKEPSPKANMSHMERSWEDMVITPMPGIPPLNCSPPYQPRNTKPLPYAESPDDKEELMFHLEMDY